MNRASAPFFLTLNLLFSRPEFPHSVAPDRCSLRCKIFFHPLPAFRFAVALRCALGGGRCLLKGLIGLNMVANGVTDSGSSNVAVLFDFDGTVGDTVRNEGVEGILDGLWKGK